MSHRISLFASSLFAGVLIAFAAFRCGGEKKTEPDPICAAVDRGCGPGSTQPDCPTRTGTTTPSARMSFFVTSVGNGARGADYGGLEGADRRCQCLAILAGAGGKTWRAYLSSGLIAGTVHARDRIGTGPWFNYRGAKIAANVEALHTSGVDSALIFTETGTTTPSREHDILTGSDEAGMAYPSFPGDPQRPPPTCRDWTDNGLVTGWVGHADWNVVGGSGRWNSAHATEQGCSEGALRSTLGSGRLYCFATD